MSNEQKSKNEDSKESGVNKKSLGNEGDQEEGEDKRLAVNAERNVRIDVERRVDNDGHNQSSNSSGILKLFMKFDPFAIGFAIVVFGGGLIGFFKKGSTASLVSSLIFAILLLISTYIEGVRRNSYPLIVTLFALYSVMLFRFGQSPNNSFMPSALVATLALVMLIRHEYLLYLRRKPTASVQTTKAPQIDHGT